MSSVRWRSCLLSTGLQNKRQVQCVVTFIYFSQFLLYHLVVTGDLKTVNNSDTKFRGARTQKHKRPVSYISLHARCFKITALGSTCGTAMRRYILTSCRARCRLSHVSILCLQETPALDPAGCLWVLQSTHHCCQSIVKCFL